jgi:ssDNA-binding Zn-finger/Zn-ribbon topoisomerase 1
MMGVGFLFGSVENILDTLEGHDKDQVQHLVNQGLVHTHYARGFSLYQCSDCHSLDNKVHLTLYNNDGELLFQTESYCGDCQKIREYMPEDIEKETIPDLHCPKCHHDTLNLFPGKLWD